MNRVDDRKDDARQAIFRVSAFGYAARLICRSLSPSHVRPQPHLERHKSQYHFSRRWDCQATTTQLRWATACLHINGRLSSRSL